MAYSILIWQDHAMTPEHTFTVTENDDGTITLTKTGTVVQQGTNLAAVNFNNMEQGILAANVSASEAHRLLRLAMDSIDSLTGFTIEATLTNSYSYPFNNSETTLAFDSDLVRYNKDYTVIVEAEADDDGFVGDIVISDKLLNGFKIAYTGSATSVTVKCYVQGGR